MPPTLSQSFLRWSAALAFAGCLFGLGTEPLSAAEAPVAGASVAATNEIRVIQLQGSAEVSRAGTTTWGPLATNAVLRAFDRVRTGPQSRLALRWSDQSVIPFGPSTELEVLPPHEPAADSGLRLIEGILSFFHRDRPGRIRIITRGAVAGVEGTEFVVEARSAQGAGRTTLSVLDGRVRFGNDRAMLVLTNGEQAVVEGDQAPVRTPGFVVNQLLQWAFYYPAVLDPAELGLSAEEESALAGALAAYRAGDLLGALALYPADRAPSSDADRIFHAALLLSVGQVDAAEAFLAQVNVSDATARPTRLVAALRRLVATVKQAPSAPLAAPAWTTELLAESYAAQAQARRTESLAAARTLVRTATTNAPGFGFAWARLAELEFSFGDVAAAQAAVDRALAAAPRHAQALALQGFLLTARHRTREALPWFDRAIAADAALAKAWCGRGLVWGCWGDLDAGREDLLVAAALEPRRAELRHYLGRAFAEDDQPALAAKEVALAKELDPGDPNAWLHSALLHQQQNEINAAIRDLEKSQDLNENRSLFRSGSLLDQDAAVRSANLARLYQDAGMANVAQREAARAVNLDYGNHAAHEFLAASYNWGTANLTSQRYETAVNAEYTVANLLAPVHAGLLSPALSQAEYSGLFARNRSGFYSSTEYLDRGAWEIGGGQYGVYDTFSYDLYGRYVDDPGQYRNNDLLLRQFVATVKLQATEADTVYFKIGTLNIDAGQLQQTYDPTPANIFPAYGTVDEDQEPFFSIGLNHEWAEGNNTLFLFSRLSDHTSNTNSALASIYKRRLIISGVIEPVDTVAGFGANTIFENESELYSAEVQQIWQREFHTTIAGTRFQAGDFHSINSLYFSDNPFVNIDFPNPPTPWADQNITTDFRRLSGYLYHQWQVIEELRLIGGLTYDWMDYPHNIWSSPVTDGQQTEEQLSPKAGVIWTPLPDTVVRFAFTRSLQGASIDQSYQIEPAQVAGFVQSFRSLVPEALVGGNPAAHFETFDLSLEQKFDTGTYLGLGLQLLGSKQDRMVGAFLYPLDLDAPDTIYPHPEGTPNILDYEERSLMVSANQLLGDEWSVGASYRLSQAALDSDFTEIPEGAFRDRFAPRTHDEALLHHANLFALFNHGSGFFAGIEGNWYSQRNGGDASALPGDSFWQGDLHAGYRFLRRRAEIRASLLNFTDQDYRLNPLNLYNNLPRDRTLALRLQIGF